MKFNKAIFYLAFFIIGLGACRFKPGDKPNWDVEVLAPLLKSSLSIQDIVNDSNYVRVNSDNSITLVIRDTLVNYLLSDYLVVPDTSLSYTVRLDSIRLTTDSIITKISIMDIARQAGYDVIIGGFHGSTTPVSIPAQAGVSSPPTPINASSLFQQATLVSGFMDVEITNYLPADVTNAQFRLKNMGLFGNTNTIVNATIASIPKNAITDTTFDLAGQTVESLMEGQLVSLDIATIPVGTAIDTNAQFVKVKIELRELRASSATAIFPEQTVINNVTNVYYFFGDGIQITRMGIEEGGLIVSAVNTIQNPIEFSYTLPKAKRFGQPISITTYLPAAVGSVSSTVDTVVDLIGCTADLQLDGDNVNVFPQALVGNLKYSGNLVTMTLQDSIRIYYALQDIVPNYIEGYLGKSELPFQGGQKLDFFNSIKSGTLDLENPKLTIHFTNSIGVDGEIELRELKGYNTRTGNQVSLTASVFDDPVFIPGPRLPNVGQTVTNRIALNQNNSNVRQFLANLPDSIVYDLNIIANKNGVPSLLNNFATGNSKISAIMDMEIPVHGVADNLTLETDLALNISEANLNANITEGGFNLFVENFFPFDATCQIYFKDANGLVLDSLFKSTENNTIAAGFANQDGIVENPSTTKISAMFDSYRLDRLRLGGKSAVVRFVLNSSPTGQPVKVYSNYKIDFKLVGDFNYSTGN